MKHLAEKHYHGELKKPWPELAKDVLRKQTETGRRKDHQDMDWVKILQMLTSKTVGTANRLRAGGHKHN